MEEPEVSATSRGKKRRFLEGYGEAIAVSLISTLIAGLLTVVAEVVISNLVGRSSNPWMALKIGMIFGLVVTAGVVLHGLHPNGD